MQLLQSQNCSKWVEILYKVVQIWPGLFTLVYTQISPGHIWTTLYIVIKQQRGPNAGWMSRTCCGVMWHSRTCCEVMWHSRTCCEVMWHSRTCCGVMWHSRTCCGVMWHSRTCCEVMWHSTTRGLQYVAQNIWSLDPLMLTLKLPSLMKLNTVAVASLFLGFLSGVTVDFILPECDTTSLGYRLLILQDTVVVWQCRQLIVQWHSVIL